MIFRQRQEGLRIQPTHEIIAGYTRQTARLLLPNGKTPLEPLQPYKQKVGICFFATPIALARAANVTINEELFEQHAIQAGVSDPTGRGVNTLVNPAIMQEFIQRETQGVVHAISTREEIPFNIDNPLLRGNMSSLDPNFDDKLLLPSERVLKLLANGIYTGMILPRKVVDGGSGLEWYAIDQAVIKENGELYYKGFFAGNGRKIEISSANMAKGIVQLGNGRYVWGWSMQKSEHTITSREDSLTDSIHASIQQCINPWLSAEERGRGWAQALNAGTDKRIAAQQVRGSLFPRPDGQTTIFSYPQQDIQWLRGLSPELEQLMKTGEVYSHAAYAIGEYFVRIGKHNLSPEQVVAVARLFPPRGNESPEDYNARVNAMPLSNLVPGKSEEEVWTMRREIIDLLEIEAQLERKYVIPAFGRTININDLTVAAANVLHLIHQAATEEGVQAIKDWEKQI